MRSSRRGHRTAIFGVADANHCIGWFGEWVQCCAKCSDSIPSPNIPFESAVHNDLQHSADASKHKQYSVEFRHSEHVQFAQLPNESTKLSQSHAKQPHQFAGETGDSVERFRSQFRQQQSIREYITSTAAAAPADANASHATSSNGPIDKRWP